MHLIQGFVFFLKQVDLLKKDVKINLKNHFYKSKKSHEMDMTRAEMGLPMSRPLNENEVARLNQRARLKRLENGLSTQREKKQYYGYKPYFVNDYQRRQFLRIGSFEGRERWARAVGLTANPSKFSPNVTKAIENNDITVGMTKQAVKESWGDPEAIEVAGNPLYGNERWKYMKVVSSSDGYANENRIIYFESGRVAGWEKQ